MENSRIAGAKRRLAVAKRLAAGVAACFRRDLRRKRLLALGATEVHWDKRPPDADYVILADPEGNRFCVVDIS